MQAEISDNSPPSYRVTLSNQETETATGIAVVSIIVLCKLDNLVFAAFGNEFSKHEKQVEDESKDGALVH